MPNNVQPSEGFASVQYKLILGQNRTLTFNSSRVTFVDAEINETVYDTCKALHTFRTVDTGFLESVRQVMSTADPILEFRLGFGTPQNTYWLPWQRHLIVNYRAKFTGIAESAGHLLIFATADALARIYRDNKVIVRKGALRDIVLAIAEENRLDAVVEPTEGKFLLYQSFQDDISFIRQRCLHRAINPKGRGGFYFFVRDNVLHFHTADYQSQPVSMNYYDVFGTELTLDDSSQSSELWDDGLAGVSVVGYDPYTGKTQETRHQPDKALRLADSIYQFDQVSLGWTNIPYHLSYNPPMELNALAQFGYQRARQQTFRSTVTLDKTINIRHGDLLNLSITQKSSSASSHSGYYYVTGVAHVVKKQAVTSVYTLERGETRGQDQSFAAQNAQNQLVPETRAPGELPNIPEIKSSELTKGAGPRASTQTYATVMNPGTGR